MGKHKRKQQPQAPVDANEAPKSFVLHRGHVTRDLAMLVGDMRGVMSPNTASKLKVLKRNVMKDFVNVAGPLGVTHMMVFTQSETHANMRIGRLPRGPTLTFRIESYCLARDVLSSMARPKLVHASFLSAPLLVLNNFPKDTPALQLLTKVFQNLFPSINVAKVDLRTIRRVVLFHFHTETGLIDFRHYDIGVRAAGTSRSVRSVVTSAVPNLADFEDIADFVIKGAQAYESEGEDASSRVVLPQTVHGPGNKEASQSAIRLSELGPRLTLRLLKIEEGLCGGSVLYHAIVQKTPEEVAALEARRREAVRLKTLRRQQQEANVKRKAAAGGDGDDDGEVEDPGYDGEQEEDDDDDAEWYRKEVGEEPSEDLGLKTRKRGVKFAPRFKRRSGAGEGETGRGDGGSDGAHAHKKGRLSDESGAGEKKDKRGMKAGGGKFRIKGRGGVVKRGK